MFSRINSTVFTAGLVVVAFSLVPAGAAAQSLEERLGSAESQAANADSRIDQATADAAEAQARLSTLNPRSAEANAAATASLEQVKAIETELIDQRTAALEEVRALESEYNDEKAAHDQEVSFAIGGGVGLVLLALVAIGWGWFRQLAAVKRFSSIGDWKPWGIAVGALVVGWTTGGGMLEGSGAVRIIGAFVIVVVTGLTVAFVLARHSIRVEANEAQSLLSRRRFPRWALLLVAAFLLLLGVGSLGSASSSESPERPQISEVTRALAEAGEGDPLTPITEELAAAQAASEPLVGRSEQLDEARQASRAALVDARRALRSGRRQLRRGQLTASRISRQIAAREAREARLQALSEPAPSSGGGGGSGSYTDCDSAPSNIPVAPGSALDGDGDGIGCED